ncbi:hypothetical protein [Methanospirillum sp.]|jgi:hypothetical protein|uniref:hypothetical protein n=1 Tax=Methanospirillum sp. TaxID=45200 RepID=UPI00359F5114
MSEKLLLQKIDNLETLIIQLNDKIDNYFGMEDISTEEREEIQKLGDEVASGEYVTLNDL